MREGRFFERVVGVAVRAPWLVLGAVIAVAAVAAVAALRLDTDAGTGTLVDEGSPEFKATEDFRQKFGDDAAVVLVRENLREAGADARSAAPVRARDLPCGGTQLGATLPRRQGTPLPAVCDQIAELAPGPGRLRARDLPL